MYCKFKSDVERKVNHIKNFAKSVSLFCHIWILTANTWTSTTKWHMSGIPPWYTLYIYLLPMVFIQLVCYYLEEFRFKSIPLQWLIGYQNLRSCLSLFSADVIAQFLTKRTALFTKRQTDSFSLLKVVKMNKPMATGFLFLFCVVFLTIEKILGLLFIALVCLWVHLYILEFIFIALFYLFEILSGWNLDYNYKTK